MNKTPDPDDNNSRFDDVLLPEYNFDYRKAKPNRFAPRTARIEQIRAIRFILDYWRKIEKR